MKTHSILYILTTVLVIAGAALQIMHVIEQPIFYLIFGACVLISFWAGSLKKKYLNDQNNTPS